MTRRLKLARNVNTGNVFFDYFCRRLKQVQKFLETLLQLCVAQNTLACLSARRIWHFSGEVSRQLPPWSLPSCVSLPSERKPESPEGSNGWVNSCRRELTLKLLLAKNNKHFNRLISRRKAVTERGCCGSSYKRVLKDTFRHAVA